MAGSNLILNLIGRDKSASKAIGKVESKVGSVSSVIKKMAGIAAGAFAVKEIVSFGKDVIKAGEAAATADSRVENITKQMGLFGKDAGKVSDRLVKLANAQALATGEDQNAIKVSQAKLLTFKEIARSADDMGGIFDRATQATIDLAAAGFGTTADNAIQLGKALNDPIKGISALTRSGVTFTEAEKKKITAMVESGNVAKAQDTILKAIEAQVGNTAAATRNASDRMKVGWSVLMEQMGKYVLPGFNAVGDVVLDKVFPAMSKMIDFVGQRLLPGLQGVYDLVVKRDFTGAFGRLFNVYEDSPIIDVIFRIRDAITGFDFSVFSPITDGFKAVFDAVKPMIPQILEVAGAFSPFHVVLKALQPMLPKLAAMVSDFIGNALALVGPVIAQILPIVQQLASMLIGALGSAFQQLLPLVTYLLSTVGALMPVMMNLIPPILSVVEALMPLVGVVIDLVTSLLPPLISIFMALLEPILALLPPLIEGLAPVLDLLAILIGESVVPVMGFLVDVLGGILSALAPVVAWIAGRAVKAITTLIGWVAKLAGGIARFVSSAVSKFQSFGEGVGNVVSGVIDWFRDLPGRILGFFTGIGDKLAAPFKSGFNAIAGFWNRSAGKFKIKIPKWVPGIGGKEFGFPQIPSLATGGIATRPTLAMVGDAPRPEVIAPLDELGRRLEPYIAGTSRTSGSTLPSSVHLTVIDRDGTLLARMETVAEDVVDGRDDDRLLVMSSRAR